MDPVLLVLLAGLNRHKNPKSAIIMLPKDVLKIIWRYVISHYRKHIERGNIFVVQRRHLLLTPLSKIGPNQIDVNMMPILLGASLKSTLPEYLYGWIPVIQSCEDDLYASKSDRLAYLTIQRSFVRAGTSQRRPGIHIDAPILSAPHTANFCNISWGESAFLSKMDGGIFIATDIAESCGVWNLGIPDLAKMVSDFDNVREGGVNLDFLRPHLDWTVRTYCPLMEQEMDQELKQQREQGIILTARWMAEEHDGDNHEKYIEDAKKYYPCELVDKQKRHCIPRYITLVPNRLYWMSDRAPHHSLPVEDDCVRTFFRLVVGEVGVRWVDDCTPNDRVKLPSNIILKKTKFS